MKVRLLMTVLLLTAAALVGKSEPPKTANSSDPPKNNHVTITGSLTKDPHEDYELVDQKGVHNLVYKSTKIDLDSYVGQSVTLVVERSAMPSTDESTRRSMPHFKVIELHPAAGKYGK